VTLIPFEPPAVAHRRRDSSGRPGPTLLRHSLRQSCRRVQEISKEIAKQSDRGAAIIAAALLEPELERAILRMFPARGAAAPRIPENLGPLIDLAYAAGVFGPVTYEDLKLIQKIRNAFAHHVEPRYLDNLPIAPLCAQLKLPDVAWAGRTPPATPRARFLTSITIVFEGTSGWQAQRSAPNVLP